MISFNRSPVGSGWKKCRRPYTWYKHYISVVYIYHILFVLINCWQYCRATHVAMPTGNNAIKLQTLMTVHRELCPPPYSHFILFPWRILFLNKATITFSWHCIELVVYLLIVFMLCSNCMINLLVDHWLKCWNEYLLLAISNQTIVRLLLNVLKSLLI